MRVTSYRLGERKIIQAAGALWWEAHAGIGAFQSGRCFVRGNILLLGSSEKEEPGYLKREFIERLRGLPEWNHTRYYCSNYSIHQCRSGRRLTEMELAEGRGIRTQAGEHTDPVEQTPTEGPCPAPSISYRLGHHEITKKTDAQWWWKTYSSSGGPREGRCIIEGGILFFGAGKKIESQEPHNLKRTFLEHLGHLPQWKATEYYCPSCEIYDCRTGENPFVQEGGGTFFIPSAKVIPSSTPMSIPSLSSSIDSTLSLLKELGGRAGRAVYRKTDEAIHKYRLWRKRKNIRSDQTATEMPVHRFPARKWIASIGAFILMVGLLLLVLLHDLWKGREHHHRDHEHSAGRHRDH